MSAIPTSQSARSVYLPPQFDVGDRGHALALMREYPFAALVSVIDGAPFVTHCPLHAHEEGSRLVLQGHLARANPHWRGFAGAGQGGIEIGAGEADGESRCNTQALAIFRGPDAYMSPSVYPDRNRVPTWNYLAVHASGPLRLIDDEAAKEALLKTLIAQHEPAYAVQWDEIAPEFGRRLLAGIVGFEIEVHRLEAKFKLNQHRPEAHAAMLAACETGGPRERELAEWMRRLGMVAERTEGAQADST